MVQFLRRVRSLPKLLRAGSSLHSGSRDRVRETSLPLAAKSTAARSLLPIHDWDQQGAEAPGEEADLRFPPSARDVPKSASLQVRSRVIWGISIGVWTFLSLAATLTIYQMYRITGNGTSLGTVAGMEFSQLLSYLPFTPFAFRLALRYPIQRGNWIKPVLLHLLAGLVFTMGHIAIRGFTPFGYWDPKHREWTYMFWDPVAHLLRFPWTTIKSTYMASVFDDVTSTYLPIVLIAHALLYNHNSQQKELRALHLSEQLAKARLQVLKSQLQPHFLFNTLHSISALMLTNVVAADRMMTYLSDLLRMSLEDKGNQLTTLNRDLEFLSVYLEIEKNRFEEKLRVAFDVDPECLDAQVPHLFLQPLVENAVRHGTSKRSQLGEIYIIAKRLDNTLEIWIQDNGPGLVDHGEDLFKRGLGLSVTRERLEGLYGSEQECRIRNIATGGAEVYVRLPFSLASDVGQTDAEHRYT